MSASLVLADVYRNEQLVQACLDRNVTNIERFLRVGADPNFQTKRSNYEQYLSLDEATIKAPLDIVTSQSDEKYAVAAAKLLLDYGADVNGGTSGETFEPPIHNAVENNNLPLTQLLVERGASIHTIDPFLGFTSLHIACGGYEGIASLPLVQFLIMNGANINVQDNRGKTPANIIASYSANQWDADKAAPIIKELSAHGADFSIVDDEQLSAWSLMQNRPDLKMAVIDGLLESDFHTSNGLTQQILKLLPQYGLTTIEELAASQNSGKAIQILDQIIETHLASIYPEKLLEHKLEQASIDVDLQKMATLLAQGADPDFTSSRKIDSQHNLPPLMLIMNSFSFMKLEDIPPAIKMLLEQGANPNIPSAEGNTPLHTLTDAAFFPTTLRQEIFDLLIKHGANVNLQNEEGQTPAHISLEHRNNFFMLTNLVKAGADLNIENAQHKTALQIIDDNPEAKWAIKDIYEPKSAPLKLADIIHTDDPLFQESNHHQKNLTPSQPSLCAAYEGYLPVAIWQWLGLESPCPVSNSHSN